MHNRDERLLVYAALLLACAVIAMGAGLMAGVFAFVQALTIIELLYCLRAGRASTGKGRWLRK